MAGIGGAVFKTNSIGNKSKHLLIKRIISGMRLREGQRTDVFEYRNACFCSVCQIGDYSSARFIEDKKAGLLFLLDGYVTINDDAVEIIRHLEAGKDTEGLFAVPILFQQYKEDLVNHLGGSYNIAIFNINTSELMVINDRFGFYPLFYYEDSGHFVFSSKIEGLVGSGLIPQIEFDYSSVAEHILFNYIVTDNTYIKGIKVLANANILRVLQDKTTFSKYWEISSAFTLNQFNKAESFEVFDAALSKSMNKIMNNSPGTINMSLTGGWDSRLALTYLLPKYKNALNLYSFGTQSSADVTIPTLITKKENLAYTPFILDDDYLEKDYIACAKDTIMLSGGTRNLKRAHYLYAIKRINQISNSLITGIFGDEVIKVGKPMGGEVISLNYINLLGSDYNFEVSIPCSQLKELAQTWQIKYKDLRDELIVRIGRLKNNYTHFENRSHHYFAFRFETNLRKYFGNEASSYNDFVMCYSPFINQQFFDEYVKTIYAGFRYTFTSQDYFVKKQTTDLYAKLIMKHYPKLAEYPSARGYSVKESQSTFRMMKTLLRKASSSRTNQDTFNTLGSEQRFLSAVEIDFPQFSRVIRRNPKLCSDPNGLSLVYWIEMIRERYHV